MDEDEIVKAVRQRREASINVAMRLVKEGKAGAMVSAGNSGAVSASGFFMLGRIEGIERPALGVNVPFNSGNVFLIDAGANADCRPSHLVQFGVMGSTYVEQVLGVRNPRVGLLNSGEESGKGNTLASEAFDRLKESTLNFVGNVEGTEVYKGVCDVLVTDGFTGNIALKTGEGIADYILQQVRATIKSSPLFVMASILLKPALKRALKSLQYEEYGGANLLGVDGIVVIAHGRSDATAFKNALRVANAAAASDLMRIMRETFAEPSASPAAGR
jgi:glycerol-3-phosphate acyltransferase PlsX